MNQQISTSAPALFMNCNRRSLDPSGCCEEMFELISVRPLVHGFSVTFANIY
jgi:hypothetical protein